MNTKRLDFPDKPLVILADGDYRGFRSGACAKEPETVEWLRRVAPGSIVWDVGASVGPYSLVAAALGAEKVVAFEPQGPSYGHLSQNIALNKMDSVIEAWGLALNDGDLCFDLLPLSAVPGSHSYGESTARPVVMLSAERFIANTGSPFPQHIKIDVDGAEMGVIEGGRHVWELAQSVMVESDEKTIEDIAVILGAAGLTQTGKWFRSGEQYNYLFERGEQ